MVLVCKKYKQKVILFQVLYQKDSRLYTLYVNPIMRIEIIPSTFRQTERPKYSYKTKVCLNLLFDGGHLCLEIYVFCFSTCRCTETAD